VPGFDVEPLHLDPARWALRPFGLEDRIELSRGQVDDLTHETRRFDFVWFTGVFYHFHYPVLALDLVRRVTRRRLMFQTLTMPGNNSAEPPSDMHIEHREPMLDPGWPKAGVHRRNAWPATRATSAHPTTHAWKRFRALRGCGCSPDRITSSI
jgi:tRNA (mo5U34)-methyltransferase